MASRCRIGRTWTVLFVTAEGNSQMCLEKGRCGADRLSTACVHPHKGVRRVWVVDAGAQKPSVGKAVLW